MIENGFYIIKKDFVELIKSLGGLYQDDKDRPMFCCFEDTKVSRLFWAIPMSDYSHRTSEQIEKIKKYCSLPKYDIRWSYYHIGYTNRKAIYRISSCFPITDKYVESPFISQNGHLFLVDKKDAITIRTKLSRILLSEEVKNNKYEQHITDIMNHLIEELRNNE